MAVFKLSLFLVIFVVVWRTGCSQDTIYMHCDPSQRHRHDDCPDGYCCVRDEFLATEVYCQKMGIDRGSCTTHVSETNCPCVNGLECKPNIQSPTFTSLYGRCTNTTLLVGK